jgi:hypothetical protein
MLWQGLKISITRGAKMTQYFAPSLCLTRCGRRASVLIQYYDVGTIVLQNGRICRFSRQKKANKKGGVYAPEKRIPSLWQ